MKKLLWLVILFPIFTSRVLASEVYYSNYGGFSEYQENFINSSDVVNVESKVMYRWYKNVQVPSEYKPYNSQDNFLNNCYETAYSDWSLNYPNLTESTIVDEKTIYNYQMIEPVRYIHLYNLKGSYGAFRITELQIFSNNEEVNYTYTCNGCWPNFDNYIHNGIAFENESYIDNGGGLTIDLGRYYPINQIKVLFYLFDMGDAYKEYTLGYSKDGNQVFISKDFKQQFSIVFVRDSKKFEHLFYDLNIPYDRWLTSNSSEEYIDNEYVYSRGFYKLYRYKDKICQTFIWNKEYYPYYSDTPVFDYNIKENEKTFYRYQTRDKLELNVHDITEKYYDLNNFVISSTSNYTIDNNINWDKNGTYKLKFTTSNISVEKDVKLVILENSLEEKDEQIKKLEEELKNTIFNYEKIIEQLENTNKDFLNDLNNLNNEIININNKINELEQTDNINNSILENLRKDLENHINQYNLKVEQIEKTNQKYTENLTMMLNTINQLDEKINLVKNNTDNNASNIDKLNEDIKNYTNELNIKIDYLESLNKTYLEKLENLELYIKTTDDKLNELENKYSALIDGFDKLQSELEDTISNYEKTVEQLDSINKEFSNDLNNLNSEIISINNKINELEQADNINTSILENLRKDLENHINQYNLKVEQIEKTNQKYTEKLTMMLNTINQLDEKISLVKNNTDNNTSDIDKLNEDIKNYTNELIKKIDYLESLNKTYLEKLENLELYIKTTNDKLNELESKYGDLTDKVNKIEDDIKQIDELNNLIDELFDEVNILHNTDAIQKENLEQVEKQLKETMVLYQNKIDHLEQFNSDNLLKLTKLQEDIDFLQQEINSLEETNNTNIDILKQQLDNKLKEYKEKINEIEEFNDLCSKKLEITNGKLLDIINQINEMKIINEDVYKNLSGQVDFSVSEIENIKNKFNNTIKDLKITNSLLNEKLNNIETNNNDNYIKIEEELERTNQYYEQLIEHLKQTNDNYLLQIKLLNDEINNLKYLFSERYNSLIENQNLLQEQLLLLNDEITSNYEQNLEKINADLEVVSKQLNNDKKESFKFDLDDYVLKINGVDTINFLWIYIICATLFVGYIVYLLKKRKD